MKLRLRELRRIVRKVVNEAEDTPTISSDLDPHEQEFQRHYPHWSGGEQVNLGANTPAQTKARQVSAVLQKKGLTSDAASKKKVTQRLVPYIREMDPQDVFLMSTDDIARKFAAEELGVHEN